MFIYIYIEETFYFLYLYLSEVLLVTAFLFLMLNNLAIVCE